MRFTYRESKRVFRIKDPDGKTIIRLDKKNGDILIRDGDDLKHKYVWFIQDREGHGSYYKLEFKDGKKIE